jgi:hypothetical protein
VAWVVGFLVVGLVLAIAAVFVFREAARMREEPPLAVFDPDDAYEWVVRHLPDIAAATLTPDDVRRILDFQLEFFQTKGVSGNGSDSESGDWRDVEVVFGSAETVDYIVRRAAETGDAYIPEQVEAVVDCQLTYLEAIGAVGRKVGPDEPEPGTREGAG